MVCNELFTKAKETLVPTPSVHATRVGFFISLGREKSPANPPRSVKTLLLKVFLIDPLICWTSSLPAFMSTPAFLYGSFFIDSFFH